jgi:hypothetical protein
VLLGHRELVDQVVALAVALAVARERFPLQEVFKVDRVVIYSPDRGVVLATHIQDRAVAAVILEVAAHTTEMTVVAPLMVQAVAAVGVRLVVATV